MGCRLAERLRGQFLGQFAVEQPVDQVPVHRPVEPLELVGQQRDRILFAGSTRPYFPKCLALGCRCFH